MYTLAYYMATASRPDAPEGSAVTDHLFRPLNSDRRSFKPAPISSTALGARLRLHLMLSGAYSGETNYSFRRGSLQYSASQGAGLDAQSQLRTEAMLKRYLDPNRHQDSRSVRSRTQPSPE